MIIPASAIPEHNYPYQVPSFHGATTYSKVYAKMPHHHKKEKHHDGSYNPAVQVLRIPADGSTPYLVIVDTCTSGYKDKAITANTEKLELILGCVLDLARFRNHINLHHRGLFDRNLDVNNLKPSPYEGEYYIYKCIEGAKCKLTQNQSFRDLKDARVYGDAFVFKVEWVDEVIGRLSQPVYGEMVQFERSLKNGGSEQKLLNSMATW